MRIRRKGVLKAFGPRFGPHCLVDSVNLPQNLTRVDCERAFGAADELTMLGYFSYLRHLILIVKDAINLQ